ncbi:MAG: 50S ribosomal protein L9 [Acidimicrobiia bacterium]
MTRIVLRSDLDQVGKRGDIVEVADGYARNYLVPKGLAFVASPGVEAQAKSMRAARDLRDAQDRGAAEEIAKRLVPAVITVKARAGSEGRLFGSVTSSDLADAIAEQTGITIDRRRLHLDEPIKALGTHSVPAKLHSDVEFPVTVEVVAS